MNISYNWLKDYIPVNLSAEKIEELLTSCGLEVESMEVVETIKGGLDKFYVGEVLTCEPHPDSDHLHITSVDVGKGNTLNIVCGAPNVEKGQKVIIATIGARIYNNEAEYFEIKKTKLRGVVSQGMICSEAELKLNNNHDGILVLDNNAKVGMPAKEYLKIEEDYVFEIGLTPNRSDAASHIGVARDLIALIRTQLNQDISLKIPSIDGFKIDNNSRPIDIKVDSNICPRYSGLTISNIEVKDSPEWLANRLRIIGLRPINNIVDITNYVLFEMGQPIHAFDLDKIKDNSIEVKTLNKGDKFITLDNVERELNGGEIMICDSEKGLCMGGIYGGKDSGVNYGTKSLFLESAYFNPVLIRKASKYHGLKTDASFRYERGADPSILIYALKRAALLIKEICGGEISSNIIDIYPNEIKQAEILLNFNRMTSLIGKEIDKKTIKEILISLGITILQEDDVSLLLSVPTNKVDVIRECDIIEEILRIYGYNNIEVSENILSSISYQEKPNKEKIQNIISDLLVYNGFYEIMNNSLTRTSYYQNNRDFAYENSVIIINALSKDLSLMRQTLVYGGLETLSYNINRKVSDIKAFEFGNTYSKNLDQIANSNITKRYNEENHLLLVLTGNNAPESWLAEHASIDFFYTKNIVMNIIDRLGIDISRFIMKTPSLNLIDEGLEYIHRDNNNTVVYFGKVNKKTLKEFDIKQDVYIADFNWDILIKSISNKNIKYKEVSKFPEVRRDLALVIDRDISFDDLYKLSIQAEKKILKDVSLFDVYQGDKLPEGKKQYALSFILQDKDNTLTDKQIESVMNKLIKTFENKVGAKLR